MKNLKIYKIIIISKRLTNFENVQLIRGNKYKKHHNSN